MRIDFSRPRIALQVVIGALIIKNKLGLSDEETIELIREHLYLSRKGSHLGQ